MAGTLTAAPLWADKVRDRRLRDAFLRVPRNAFLDATLRMRAADDCALPIGHSQTTSQPLVIIRMLEMLFAAKNPPQKVLEVGAGCGYQTAILATVCKKVIALERIGALARQTATRLRTMGYNNAHVIHADGFDGHAKEAPFDGIILCAEHSSAPDALVSQLAPEARLVMPLTSAGNCRLVAVGGDGRVSARRDMVNFVPMLPGRQK